ncbi:MAG: hypothetical protein HZB51_26865 [Chloroflexi bacterium]|nr:hypothetical protein [Chloroflexota bacterium]
MAKIAPELLSKLQRHPDATVNVIVRLTDDPSAHLTEIKASRLNVRYTYSLIAAVAVQGKAAACLKLASQPWVLSIEEDKSVHTMS